MFRVFSAPSPLAPAFPEKLAVRITLELISPNTKTVLQLLQESSSNGALTAVYEAMLKRLSTSSGVDRMRFVDATFLPDKNHLVFILRPSSRDNHLDYSKVCFCWLHFGNRMRWLS